MQNLKQNRITLSGTTWAWGALLLSWVLVFTPHLVNSGFVSDDWSVVRSAFGFADFWDLYRSWFPLFSNRPVAPLVLSLVAKVSLADPRGYILVGLAFWLSSLVILANVLKRFLSLRFVVVFLALASFPSIASTVIFSIATQLVGVASIFFWSLSFLLLDRHLAGKGRLYLAGSYFLVLLSLLTYEITLPLLALNVLYPALFQPAWSRTTVKRHLALYLAPMGGVVTLILLLQKVVMPAFMTVYSRFSPGPLSNCLHNFLTWCWALLVDLPLLLLNSVQTVFEFRSGDPSLKGAALLLALLFAVLLYGVGRANTSTSAGTASQREKKIHLLGIILLALFLASFLYILSGSGAQVAGYPNRGMTSTWIVLALLVAVTADLFWDLPLAVLVFLLIFLNLCCFMVQRERYAVSWSLQREIAASAASKLVAARVPMQHATLLGHVPWHVPDNLNGEVVFQDSWDFSAALWFADKTINVSAMPVNPSSLPRFKVRADGVALDYWESNYGNLWFYEYNARLGSASLVRIANAGDAKAVAARVAAAKFNSWRPPVSERVKELFGGRVSLPLAAAISLLYGVFFWLLSRGRHRLELPVSHSGVCRVCGGTCFSTWKDGDVLPEAVSADHFKVTDSSYGTTYAIERCAGCGFYQGSSSDVLEYYRAMEDPEYESGRIARTRQFRDVIGTLGRFVPSGRLLDVGAGTGMLVEEALACGYHAEGIEPSRWMSAQARQMGLPVVNGVLPDPRVSGPFAAATLVDVIEHVTDPAQLLAEVHGLIEPGGYLLLTTPDIESVAARVMGRRWWHFRLAHVSYFSSRTISLLLQRCGFEIVHVSRPTWYFELAYLVERLLTFVPGVNFRLPARFAKSVVPLNLFDSMQIVCRKR
ncbi:class I SAM-dependent methyltransferase [Geomonas paludis]|uniref:Class I SAM-dependent methyltransferase n=1 Tax=Geomonas paludis TaxID=2740185 RepID=A0A6V8MWC7_9BACT|nr:class I SAM-dependent methyltransferase [Geomonas paludis]UPU34376.1 class I SAM-dependent methyltransferase [Geomonas paludis]GFO64361.1 hypothetical protein GMPD_22800 [Geomonas paludis]